MAGKERNLQTSMSTKQNKEESDEADGRVTQSSVSDSDSEASKPEAPVDPAVREAWLAAFRTVAGRRGVRAGIKSGQLGDALRLAGFVVTEAEVSQYRDEADPAASGTVGAEAFLAVAAKARREVVFAGGGGSGEDFETLRSALAVFDKPLSGRIKAGDLRRFLTSLGEPIDDGDVSKMLEHLVDDQGLLDYNELAHRLVGL